MGRGRKGIIVQGSKKKREYEPLAMKDNDIFGQEKTTLKQTTVYLPEEVLNQLRQMNPRDVANIIVN